MIFNYDGIDIYYEVFGEGEQWVVLLHGWGGNVASFGALKDFLPKNYKYLNIDLPPFGYSDSPKDVWGVENYSHMLKQLTDNLGIKKINIISHSFGGRVAICFASDYNESVNKIVLTSSAGLKSKFNLITKLKILCYKIKKKFGLKQKNAGSKDYRALNDNMQKSFVKIVNENLENRAKLITQDTLLIWGKTDKETPLYMGKKLCKLIKGSRLIVFDKGGHFAYITNIKAFCNLISIFFDEGDI